MMSGLTEMDWIPHSPDMNWIENCWGMLSRAVYDGGRQYDSVDDSANHLSTSGKTRVSGGAQAYIFNSQASLVALRQTGRCYRLLDCVQ